MKLKAFTLTELLIALAVLGLIIAILMPIVSNLLPDQNALIAKRSFYAMQTIVSDLMNDEACYPDHTQSIYNDQRVGLDDGFGYADCILWGGTAETAGAIDTEDSATKFAVLFSNRLDKEGDGTTDFVTGDGAHWIIAPAFTANSAASFARISVDVNGAEEPNCSQAGQASATLATGANCQGRNSDFDIFSVQVFADGRLNIEDQWARDAVNINKNVTGSDNAESPAANPAANPAEPPAEAP